MSNHWDKKDALAARTASEPNTPTPEAARLAEIRARAEKATPGPWEWVGYDGDHHNLESPSSVIHSDGSAGGEYSADINVHGSDGQFIAHSRADIPYLLDLAATQAQRIAELEAGRDDIRHRWIKHSEEVEKLKEAAESQVASLTKERDDAQQSKREIFESLLRDGKRDVDALAREIVETLRPLDEPGSSEYNVQWVGSKLKSVKLTTEAQVASLREALEAIAIALKEPAGGEYWTARTFLDKRDIFHGDLQNERVLLKVAEVAILESTKGAQ